MKNKKKVVIIVAHPDDETIWMGGTLIRNKNKWNTTIISLCRKNDLNREPKFKKICEILNAKSFISDLDDEELKPISLDEIIKRILEFAEKSYDYIFTHGENGEYGHIRHIEVNKAVKEIIEKKLISAERIFFFAYENKNGECIPKENADNFIKLNTIEHLKKKELIQNIYGFKKNSFEEKSCKKIESFNEL